MDVSGQKISSSFFFKKKEDERCDDINELAFDTARCESANDLFLQGYINKCDRQCNNHRHCGKAIPGDAVGVLACHVVESHGEGVVFGLGKEKP